MYNSYTISQTNKKPFICPAPFKSVFFQNSGPASNPEEIPSRGISRIKSLQGLRYGSLSLLNLELFHRPVNCLCTAYIIASVHGTGSNPARLQVWGYVQVLQSKWGTPVSYFLGLCAATDFLCVAPYKSQYLLLMS